MALSAGYPSARQPVWGGPRATTQQSTSGTYAWICALSWSDAALPICRFKASADACDCRCFLPLGRSGRRRVHPCTGVCSGFKTRAQRAVGHATLKSMLHGCVHLPRPEITTSPTAPISLLSTNGPPHSRWLHPKPAQCPHTHHQLGGRQATQPETLNTDRGRAHTQAAWW